MSTTHSPNRLFSAIEAANTFAPVESRMTETANGALTYASSGSAVLNLFSRGAAMRKVTEEGISNLVAQAMQENPEFTVATLFYLRDILEGQGERRFFRIALRYLAVNYPHYLLRLVPFVPEYGRWDDLFALEGTNFYSDALQLMAAQLKRDALRVAAKGDKATISLVAKWVGTDTSGKKSRQRAQDLRLALGLEEDDSGRASYRRLVSRLRKQLGIIERKMCAGEWGEINYSHVPSKATVKYRKAFKKHDGERYQAYLDEMKKPAAERDSKTKMNTKTLTPFDIVHKILYGHEENQTLEVAWDNLPDFINGEHSVLVVADTSGSMHGEPLSAAVSLALYVAERNQGAWANQFITFATNPTLQSIRGKTITDKVKNLSQADWDTSTNLQRVFDLVLHTAIRHELSPEELPKTIAIVSDMQFNQAVNLNHLTNFQQIDKKFRDAGYPRPNLVFWHVNAGLKQDSPVQYNEQGVALVSGNSPAIFRQVVSGDLDPIKAMLKVINSERYQPVIQAIVEANAVG